MDKGEGGIILEEGLEQSLSSLCLEENDDQKKNERSLPISFSFYNRNFQELEKMIMMENLEGIDWKQLYVDKTSGDYDSSWMEKVTLVDMISDPEDAGDEVLAYFRNFGSDIVRALGNSTTQLGLYIGYGDGLSQQTYADRVRWYVEKVPSEMQAVKRLYVRCNLDRFVDIDFDRTTTLNLDYLCFHDCSSHQYIHYLMCKCTSIKELSITQFQAINFMEECPALKLIQTLCIRDVNNKIVMLAEEDVDLTCRKNIFKWLPGLIKLVIADVGSTSKESMEKLLKTSAAFCSKLSTVHFPDNMKYYLEDKTPATTLASIPSINHVHVSFTAIAEFPPTIIQHFTGVSTITIHCEKVPSMEEWTQRIEGWNHSAFPKLTLVEHYKQPLINTTFPLIS